MRHPKKYGTFSGTMIPIANGLPPLPKAPMLKQTGNKEARFCFSMAMAGAW